MSRLRPPCADGYRKAAGRSEKKIATLEELESEFSVARVTVRQAIELLQDEGLLKSHQGKGTFVMRTPKHDGGFTWRPIGNRLLN